MTYRTQTTEGTTHIDTKPLVFVDVDGVINALRSNPTSVIPEVREAHHVWMPRYIPERLAELAEVAEVRWLTAWREAVLPMAAMAGIPTFKVVTDGRTPGGFVDWKWPTARPIAKEAWAKGREVWWIEDFGDSVMCRAARDAGVNIIDTVATQSVLTEGTIVGLIEWIKGNLDEKPTVTFERPERPAFGFSGWEPYEATLEMGREKPEDRIEDFDSFDDLMRDEWPNEDWQDALPSSWWKGVGEDIVADIDAEMNEVHRKIDDIMERLEKLENRKKWRRKKN